MSVEVKRVETTVTDEQYTRLVREAEKRGMTLAAYIRQRVLIDAQAVVPQAGGEGQAAALAERVGQLAADIRATIVVQAAIGAVVTEAEDADRETLTRTALELFDKMRKLRVNDKGAADNG